MVIFIINIIQFLLHCHLNWSFFLEKRRNLSALYKSINLSFYCQQKAIRIGHGYIVISFRLRSNHREGSSSLKSIWIRSKLKFNWLIFSTVSNQHYSNFTFLLKWSSSRERLEVTIIIILALNPGCSQSVRSSVQSRYPTFSLRSIEVG